MIQNVVPLLPGSDFDKLSQEKRRSLGDGGQLCDVFGLPLQAVDLHRRGVNSDVRATPSGRQRWVNTHHHLVHDGVTTEDVVFPRMLLHMVLHPRGLPRARQADHHYDL